MKVVALSLVYSSTPAWQEESLLPLNFITKYLSPGRDQSPILVVLEDPCPPIPPTGNVIPRPRIFNSQWPWHGKRVPKLCLTINNRGLTPIFSWAGPTPKTVVGMVCFELIGGEFPEVGRSLFGSEQSSQAYSGIQERGEVVI